MLDTVSENAYIFSVRRLIGGLIHKFVECWNGKLSDRSLVFSPIAFRHSTGLWIFCFYVVTTGLQISDA